MDGKLVLDDSLNYLDEEYLFYQSRQPYGYEIHICTDLTEDFISLISHSNYVDKNIEFSIATSEDVSEIEFYKQHRNSTLELLQNAGYVSFKFEIEKAIEYIKKNPILKTKKIIFNDVFDLSLENVQKIKTEFGEDTDNIYFDVVGNVNAIKFTEYSDTVKIIDEIVDKINKFNFSPLERIMFIYDFVRNKVYREEDIDEDIFLSRSLSSALLGDKIVCFGYAMIFQTLLKKVGIDSYNIYLKNINGEINHTRIEIYVKDEKYNVNGVYYFDPTWDSKRSDSDISYLYSYRYFAMTKEKMDLIDKGLYIHEDIPYFTKHIAEEFKKIVDEKDFEGIPPKMLKSVNCMCSLIYGESLISKFIFNPMFPDILRPDKDKVFHKLKRITNYFNKPLSAEILLSVLYNVRKNEYYLEPEKYPFGLNEFFKTVVISNWEFNPTQIEKFFLEFSDDEMKKRIKSQQIMRYSDETDLYKNIEGVKLAKVLRKVYNKKKSE